ncbi:hypothetical protein RI844_07255 [Thalassotalea fonticola]|uniref:Uncharacterized protein n=1 Tax=Thalassotalea fonticola TaxID=3065649 RepID=A0ABZ0GTB9_9GAMM|nr:hypothetical protein RI844_07255 [Colwelliaceae bacterium S1-1]
MTISMDTQYPNEPGMTEPSMTKYDSVITAQAVIHKSLDTRTSRV